jgi:formyl-CoA transferase
MWPRLCVALGLDGLVDDPRFTTNADRLAHRAELDAILEPELASRTYEEIERVLREAEVAVGPVNSMADLFADDAVWEEGALIRVDDERLGRAVAMPGVVPHLSATPGRVRHVGAEAGEHTAEVLRERLDLGDPEIASLVADGIVA